MIEIIVVFTLILLGYLVDKKINSNISFKMPIMPVMKPISIPTKNKGFWGGVWTWIMVTRKWELVEDFIYYIDGDKYRIPRGFIFDGASVPKFFRSWLSPMGVLLIGGLIHDYGYKYTIILRMDGTAVAKDQKAMDKLFRDISIEVNGFKLLNYIAYYALRAFGFIAWSGHRKVGAKWND